VPVAPPETVAALRPLVDDAVVLYAPIDLGSIGFYYRDFRQLSDDEVIALLAQAPADASAAQRSPAG